MKIYKTQEEIERDIVDGVLTIQGDVRFECSFSISASIRVIAGNINACDINAWNIDACDIDAWNIDAWDINARNINARNIDACDILYYAFCGVYNSIKCIYIKGKRGKHNPPVCLDGQLTYKNKEEEVQEMTVEEVSKLVGKKVKIVE